MLSWKSLTVGSNGKSFLRLDLWPRLSCNMPNTLACQDLQRFRDRPRAYDSTDAQALVDSFTPRYEWMLVLSRKRDQQIVIGDAIVITIVEVRGDKVRLGIQAPAEIPVHRREVYDALQQKPSTPAGEV